MSNLGHHSRRKQTPGMPRRTQTPSSQSHAQFVDPCRHDNQNNSNNRRPDLAPCWFRSRSLADCCKDRAEYCNHRSRNEEKRTGGLCPKRIYHAPPSHKRESRSHTAGRAGNAKQQGGCARRQPKLFVGSQSPGIRRQQSCHPKNSQDTQSNAKKNKAVFDSQAHPSWFWHNRMHPAILFVGFGLVQREEGPCGARKQPHGPLRVAAVSFS